MQGKINSLGSHFRGCLLVCFFMIFFMKNTYGLYIFAFFGIIAGILGLILVRTGKKIKY